jgi:hypothetical protein
MSVRFIDVTIGDASFRARLLDEHSPRIVAAFWDALPVETAVEHGQWSGAMVQMPSTWHASEGATDPGVGFQYPGLVVYEPDTGEVALCYGQGRLNHHTLPLTPIPLAEIGGDLGPLVDLCRSLQWDGAKPVVFARATDQDSPLAPPPEAKGRKIEVGLGDVVLTATLLEDRSPGVTAAFAAQLPLSGQATNTVSSGPLTRFWNPNGGPEGETPLPVDPRDRGQTILYPGHLYYLPTSPWRGIRIAREATIMRGPVGGGAPQLIPLARFDGDWSTFAATAERLPRDGAKPMSFRLV